MICRAWVVASLDVRMVYAEPYERDGVTVIAAAKVAGGGGGGNGHDEKGQEGEGGGFGLTAKPAGAYIIKDGQVRWAPAIDVNRLVVTMGVIAIAGLFVATRIAGIQAKAGQ